MCKNIHKPVNFFLFAANGSAIQSFGLLNQTLDFGLKRAFSWPFIIADVATPIVGADFLNHFDLIVDIKRKRLLDGNTNLSVAALNFECPSTFSIKSIIGDSPCLTLLKEFPALTQPALLNKATRSHSTHHFIKTTDGPPVASRPRRLAPAMLKIARQQFAKMLELGLARPSSGPWSSPLHLVPKKDGDWRPCGDYRRLNHRTIPDKYPVRYLDDFAANLHNKSLFSVIDLVRAFNQIPVAPDDIPKTAIITPFGLFEFPFMTFGLRNAAQTFQRFIDEVTRDFDFVFPYIDDLLVASANEQQHLQHLRLLFQRLQDYGLVINVSKCQLGQRSVIFLGHRINAFGMSPTAERVKDVCDIPPPQNIKALRRFLGALNSYRKFLKNAAATLAPLNKLLEGPNVKSNDSIIWTSDLNSAFQAAKDLLANATMLVYPNVNAPWAIFCDASTSGIGAVLQQYVDGTWQPLAFFSRKLAANVRKLSTYDRELNAMYEAVRHFKYIFEGRHVTIYTDHKPLTHAFEQQNDRANPWQFRRFDFIAQFTTDVQHISGDHNTVADALSRVESICSPVAAPTLSDAQSSDTELQRLLNDNTSALRLERIKFDDDNLIIYCDTSTSTPRPFVPVTLRKQIFDSLHSLSHPGIRASLKLVASRFVWPSINKDCRLWAKSCLRCQKSKILRHISAPIANFQLPSQRFEHIHIDLVTMPMSKGHNILLTIIDRFTRFPEAVPLQDGNTETVVRALINNWIARYGVPLRITSDRGGQFESAVFKSLADLFAIHHLRTTPYHPQANGLVERFHRHLKASLLCHGDAWFNALPVVLLGLRSCFKEDLKTTPAELVYGEPIRLPGEIFAPSNKTFAHSHLLKSLKQHFNALCSSSTNFHGTRPTFICKKLSDCSHVFIRNDRVKQSFSSPYEGPYAIVERHDKYFIIDFKGRPTPISIDRLKPTVLLPDIVNFISIANNKSKKQVTFSI